MRENILRPEPGVWVYPEPAQVFVPDQVDLLRPHLHPLISIELGQVNASWTGWVHLLSPLEPAEGYLGAGTEAFHGPLQTTNWLGFALDNDRYRLLGDVRYFQRAASPQEANDPILAEHCQAEERSYHAHRATFHRERQLIRVDDDGSLQYGDRTPVALLEQLGGPAEVGNWADPNLFPLEDDGEQVWPISPAGNRFQFVGAVPGWHYRRSGADWILLFFEPTDRLALLTFDWG